MGVTGRDGPFAHLAEDVMKGLDGRPRTIPPKYFYDATGSELFVEITRLPEYYQTRTEQSILEARVADIVERARPRSLVELGSGASHKTRVLLDTLQQQGELEAYVPVDVSSQMLRETAQDLRVEYPDLLVEGIVHDFEEHLETLPGNAPHLLLFLGSTIGNLEPQAAGEFLRGVRRALRPGDHFLLGTDLVKAPDVLIAAYDDAQGVTARFNKNMLAVLNRELDADFDTEAFAHRAVWDPIRSRIEMHLVAKRPQEVRLAALDLSVDLEEGESIRTEISCKYTREAVVEMLAEAGLEVVAWYTDPKAWFGMSLSTPMSGD